MNFASEFSSKAFVSAQCPQRENGCETNFRAFPPQMFNDRSCRGCKFISGITKRRGGVKRVSCEARENNENKYSTHSGYVCYIEIDFAKDENVFRRNMFTCARARAHAWYIRTFLFEKYFFFAICFAIYVYHWKNCILTFREYLIYFPFKNFSLFIIFKILYLK